MRFRSLFKHSHVGSCCAPGPCPGSRLPSPNEATCQPGQRPRPPVRWEMLKARSELGPHQGPPGHHKLQQEPLGLVVPPRPRAWHRCVARAASPGSQLLSLGGKLGISDFFGLSPRVSVPTGTSPSSPPPVCRAAPASTCWKWHHYPILVFLSF